MDEYIRTRTMLRDSDSDYEEDTLENEDNLSEDERLLGLFEGKNLPNYKITWRLFEKGREYNARINLEETVKVNENFFIGRVA